MRQIQIVIPVFNDWQSLDILMEAIETIDLNYKVKFIVVNDGSSEFLNGINSTAPIQILDLNQNLGHQRAIAIGLCYAADNILKTDAVIVMDGDGEDKPSDISVLVKAALDKHEIVFAKRKSRHEGFVFKAFYLFYRIIFKLLIGKAIDFGNFSAIPAAYLRRVCSNPNIWNHYSGSIIRSKLPYSTIPRDKGRRYSGNSKMNLVSLVVHGLSAISIHMDTLTVRILLFCFFSAITILITGIIMLFLVYSNPFFYSTTFLFIAAASMILLFFVAGISLLFSLNILLNRNRLQKSPLSFYTDFIYKKYTLSN